MLVKFADFVNIQWFLQRILRAQAWASKKAVFVEYQWCDKKLIMGLTYEDRCYGQIRIIFCVKIVKWAMTTVVLHQGLNWNPSEMLALWVITWNPSEIFALWVITVANDTFWHIFHRCRGPEKYNKYYVSANIYLISSSCIIIHHLISLISSAHVS